MSDLNGPLLDYRVPSSGKRTPLWRRVALCVAVGVLAAGVGMILIIFTLSIRDPFF